MLVYAYIHEHAWHWRKLSPMWVGMWHTETSQLKKFYFTDLTLVNELIPNDKWFHPLELTTAKTSMSLLGSIFRRRLPLSRFRVQKCNIDQYDANDQTNGCDSKQKSEIVSYRNSKKGWIEMDEIAYSSVQLRGRPNAGLCLYTWTCVTLEEIIANVGWNVTHRNITAEKVLFYRSYPCKWTNPKRQMVSSTRVNNSKDVYVAAWFHFQKKVTIVTFQSPKV